MQRWEELARQMRKEPLILDLRISGLDLKKIYDQGMAVIKEFEGEIIAFRGLWPARGNGCLEMGGFWIKPEWRGRKLGSRIMGEIYALFPENKTVFVVTRNPKVIHLLRKHKWQEAGRRDWDAVIPFQASCGPCNQCPENEKQDCPLRAKQDGCKLFYYTAGS